MPKQSERFREIDCLRGIAVLLMAAYHFAFDLDYFGILDAGIGRAPMQLIAAAIGATFLLLVGISLSLSFARNSELSEREFFLKQFKRGVFLAGIAGLITLATFIYPNKGFIVFGIIHLIAFSVLLSPVFRDSYWLNLGLGAIMIIAGIAARAIAADTPIFVWLGFVFPGFYTLDYYPVLPWFGVVLVGMFAGKTLYPNAKRAFKLPAHALHSLPRFAILEFAGRHSLAIYLLHQPLLVGIIQAYLVLAQ